MALESRNRSLLNINIAEQLFNLDPEVRNLARRLEKSFGKEVHSSYSIVFNETKIYMYIAAQMYFQRLLRHKSKILWLSFEVKHQ